MKLQGKESSKELLRNISINHKKSILKTNIFLVSLFLLSLIVPIVCFAQEIVAAVQPSTTDIINAVSSLISNWKALGSIGIVAAIINVIVLILSSQWCKGWFGKKSPMIKRIIIVVLGQVAGVLTIIIGGAGWVDALVTGLISSGGAVALWEALKPVFKKKI